MVKKIIGYGLLVIIAFFVAILTIPSTISPSVTKEIKADPKAVKSLLTDIQKFKYWDPKSISDSTVLYSFSSENDINFLQVTDSLNNIIATYEVKKSNSEEVHITVDLPKVDLYVYRFKLTKTELGTKINWSMDFESNLMIYMLGAERKLEMMFSEGLNSFQKILTNN